MNRLVVAVLVVFAGVQTAALYSIEQHAGLASGALALMALSATTPEPTRPRIDRHRLMTGMIVSEAAPSPTPSPSPEAVHRYKVVTGDGGESVIEGTEITTNGWCVEVTLNGRTDTIACGIKYITELPPLAPAAEAQPEAKPNPAPSVLREQRSTVARLED